MKAVVTERYGTPDVLELRDVATPTPKANEVLFRVHAASVNDWDWGMLRGTAFVNRIFNGLFSAFQQGDEVYGDLCMSGFGAFAEYACAPEAGLARKPPAMTFEQAAAIPQAGMRVSKESVDLKGVARQ